MQYCYHLRSDNDKELRKFQSGPVPASGGAEVKSPRPGDGLLQ